MYTSHEPAREYNGQRENKQQPSNIKIKIKKNRPRQDLEYGMLRPSKFMIRNLLITKNFETHTNYYWEMGLVGN